MNFTFMDENQKRMFENQYRKILIIGISLVISTILYMIIVHTIPYTQDKQLYLQDVLTLRYVILGITLVIAFAIRAIRALLLKKINKPDFPAILKRLSVSAIITLALCESIAVIGLIEYFIIGIKLDFYLTIFLAFVFFAVHFPRKSQWESYINLSYPNLNR